MSKLKLRIYWHQPLKVWVNESGNIYDKLEDAVIRWEYTLYVKGL